MGKLIVIEGLDGSGKSTQAALLAENLEQEGYKLLSFKFPNYGGDSSALIKMYLNGEFGASPGDVNAFAASAFYAVDRYATYKKDWGDFYNNGGIILADRYATSNIIHQCAKLPQNEWDSFVAWLADFEYNKLQIPAPDKVLYLDVEPGVSRELLQRRYAGHGKPDIHEQDLEYLYSCREVALWGAEKLGWNVISCNTGHEMRPREDITRQLLAIIEEAL